MTREGDIPAIRIGKIWQFEKDLIAYWNGREMEAGGHGVE